MSQDTWVFDLDGTLIDTKRASRRAIEKILGRDLGQSVSGWTDRALLDHFGVDLHEYIAHLRYAMAHDAPTRIEHGCNLLRRAIDRGDRVCLLTGCHILVADLKLWMGYCSGLLELPFWDAEFGWWPTKLDAARALRARLPVSPGTIWLVGDNDADYACAIDMGANFIRVGEP